MVATMLSSTVMTSGSLHRVQTPQLKSLRPTCFGSVAAFRSTSSVRETSVFRVMAKGKGGEEGGRKLDDSCFGKMAKSPNFTLLSSCISKAGLEQKLMGKGPLTVFAPNDDAFLDTAKEMGMTKMEFLANPDLESILKNHVVEGKLESSGLKDGQEVTTVGGGKVKISTQGGVSINGAKVKKADFPATNGVLHVIDHVLVSL